MALAEDKKYVLYIVPTDRNCTELMEQLKKDYNHVLNKTHVQDVRALPSRPPWLQFVPTLVERSSKQMFAGNDVMDFIKVLPQELTFDFVGGGGGKRNCMNSLSNGSSLNSVKLNTLKSTFTLEDEQKAAQTQAARPPAPPGSRAAEQQRREAETQQRLAEVNASRQAAMPRQQPGDGARMTQDRHFQVESIGSSPYGGAPRPGPPPSGPYGPPQGQGYGPQGQGYGPQGQGYGPPQGQGYPQGLYGPPQGSYGSAPGQGYPQGLYGPPQGSYGPAPGQRLPQPQGQPSMLARFHPGSTGYSPSPQQSPYGSPGHFPSMY